MVQRPLSGCLTVPGTLTRWLRTFLDVPAASILGCTDAEILEVEAVAGRALPLAYKQMLREAGKAFGSRPVVEDHFRRSFLLYPRVLQVRQIAADVIRDRGDESLLDRAFPFYNWEIYRIYLLDLSRPSDDPPVLVLNERTGQAQQCFHSLSQCIGQEIMGLANAIG